MAYNQPQHGGEADSYYNQGGQGNQGQGDNQSYGMENRGQPQYNQQYNNNQQPQYPPQGYQQNQPYPNDGPPQQYPQQPPQYGQGPPPPQQQNGGGKADFNQQFKVASPKYNDLWAALLFLATFAGFVAVSGLTIYGYSSTKASQGGGIYNPRASGIALDSNTIILL